MVGTQVSKELQDQVLELVEAARATGKIKKGSNEVTKALEKGKAKIVAIAANVQPPEIVMHLPLLAKEKDILCIEAGSKEELGAAAGLDVSTVAIVVTEEGEGKLKALLEALSE